MDNGELWIENEELKTDKIWLFMIHLLKLLISLCDFLRLFVANKLFEKTKPIFERLNGRKSLYHNVLRENMWLDIERKQSQLIGS